MGVLSLTSDHLVQVGGTGAPQRVTVLAGAPVCYSHDRTRVSVGTVAVGDAVTFEQSAWMWSPHLSDIRVEDAPQTTLKEALEQWQISERLALREKHVPAPEPPPKRFSRLYVPAAVVLGAGWLAGVLGAVGILH